MKWYKRPTKETYFAYKLAGWVKTVVSICRDATVVGVVKEIDVEEEGPGRKRRRRRRIYFTEEDGDKKGRESEGGGRERDSST